MPNIQYVVFCFQHLALHVLQEALRLGIFRIAKHAHRHCERRQAVARLGIFRKSKGALPQAEVTFLSFGKGKNDFSALYFTQNPDTTF